MKIRKISFYSVDRKEDGTICKCCGSWIKNVCVVDTEEEGRITLGTTCYEKQIKSRLNDMQKKRFNQLVKSVKCLQDRVSELEEMTEESYKATHQKETDYKMVNGTYEKVENWIWETYTEPMTFEDYRQFELEVFKNRLDETVRELAKYKIVC